MNLHFNQLGSKTKDTTIPQVEWLIDDTDNLKATNNDVTNDEQQLMNIELVFTCALNYRVL